MLFQRQRLLLCLLDALGGEKCPTDFQKLLFLFTQQQDKPSYEFVPYKFGCFSFTSYADKRRLVERGLLADDETRWALTEDGRTATKKKNAITPEILRISVSNIRRCMEALSCLRFIDDFHILRHVA